MWGQTAVDFFQVQRDLDVLNFAYRVLSLSFYTGSRLWRYAALRTFGECGCCWFFLAPAATISAHHASLSCLTSFFSDRHVAGWRPRCCCFRVLGPVSAHAAGRSGRAAGTVSPLYIFLLFSTCLCVGQSNSAPNAVVSFGCLRCGPVLASVVIALSHRLRWMLMHFTSRYTGTHARCAAERSGLCGILVLR